jgi:hypothetical protein
MTAFAILAAAMICAYLCSPIVTFIVVSVLRRIDAHARKVTLPPQLLICQVPPSAQNPGLPIVFASAILVLSLTIPATGLGDVKTNIGS